MTRMRATYRLQFRNGMTFSRAAELVPYMADLGISHLYASPIFTAQPGSSHGYDVTDHQELDPALGGAEGFARLAKALRDHEMGLLLDIVPNHMAASTHNRWWRDVLKLGKASRFAGHFDIDWSAPKILLPVLSEPYGEALVNGALSLRIDEDEGELGLGYQDLVFPLAPHSCRMISEELRLNPTELEWRQASPAQRMSLKTAIERASTDHAFLHRVHEMQNWRLSYWRLAREALTHRRFFEIAELVGVRVEDEAVFSDVHALCTQLAHEGVVEGLRIDHIDGLADPKAYLARLRKTSGAGYVVVEKILAADEDLPGDWPCEGTTGYEVARLITGLQLDSARREALTQAWLDLSADDPDYSDQVVKAKRRLLGVNFAGELRSLVRLAHDRALGDPLTRDFGSDAIRIAVIELAAALPVYRTYIDERGPSAQDRAVIDGAVERVMRGREAEDERVIRFVASVLLEPVGSRPDRGAFARRFQQVTGALAAKAVEDTVFYRYNRLVALNEVGAAPDAFGVNSQAFHEAMVLRQRDWPQALSATATHDTKRGEDARARLAVLSEIPDEWASAVARWQKAARDLREELPRGPAPGQRAEWLFYQSLAAAWPPDLSLSDEEGLADLCERLVGFMTKASREAKRRTSWTDPNEPFESALADYVRQLFSPDHRSLLRDIHVGIMRIAHAGLLNALSQLALKLTVPGVPDIYQGCELLDFSMVDPDNRRAVDFEARRALLAKVRLIEPRKAMQGWREGVPKMWLLERLLGVRKRRDALFARGSYSPVSVEGPQAGHVVAFRRQLDDEAVIVAVPRLMQRYIDSDQDSWLAPVFDTTFVQIGSEAKMIRTLNDTTLAHEGGKIALSHLWREFPIAILEIC